MGVHHHSTQSRSKQNEVNGQKSFVYPVALLRGEAIFSIKAKLIIALLLRENQQILIKASHRTKGSDADLSAKWVIGSVRSLKEKVMTLRTKEDSNFPVSYKKPQLLCRFNRIIYLY